MKTFGSFAVKTAAAMLSMTLVSGAAVAAENRGSAGANNDAAVVTDVKSPATFHALKTVGTSEAQSLVAMTDRELATVQGGWGLWGFPCCYVPPPPPTPLPGGWVRCGGLFCKLIDKASPK